MELEFNTILDNAFGPKKSPTGVVKQGEDINGYSIMFNDENKVVIKKIEVESHIWVDFSAHYTLFILIRKKSKPTKYCINSGPSRSTQFG